MTPAIAPLSVRLDPALAAALERHCVLTGQTRSRAVQRALALYLATRAGPTLGDLAEAVLPSPAPAERPEGASPRIASGGRSVKTAIVDPGFLVGVFDELDPLHRGCRGFLRSYAGRLLTTQAALAQALALLSRDQQLRLLEWLGKAARAGLVEVDPEPIDVRAVENLARTRSERPLDLAEATLVLLAERTGISDILAADPHDFDAVPDGRLRFIAFPEEAGIA